MYFVICLTFALLSNVQAQYYDDYGEIDLECRADSHQVLYESQRRVLPSLPQEQSPDQGSLCDSLNLLTGWYRFALDGMAANFASECVMPKQCGTSSPIWLRAKQNDSIVTYDDRPTLPAKDEKKMIMACVSVESDCCAHTIPIQVRNCGEFFVYFLWIPSYVRKMHSCPSFCAENKAATPRIGRDTEVAYGFALPRVISTDVRNTGAFQLRCVFEKPPRVEIANKASYLVSWMLLPTTGGIKELLKTEETTETFSMINLMKIDVTVTCSVKVVDKADSGSVLIPSVESAEFYLGLQFEPSHVTLGEGEIQKIVVTSSVPLPCRSEMPDCQMSIFLALRDSVRVDNLPPNVLMVSSCSVAVTRSDCREGICGRGQFEIAGIQDFTDDGDRETYIESVPLLSLDVLWSNYNPPGIRVSVQNLPTAQCHSVMDPHIATLDGALRELHMTGTFVLYKSLKRTFEVHSRVWDKCGEQNNTVSAWCHCGVAAREGDDVILIDMCDGGELTNGAILPRIEIVSELPLAVGTHIIQSNQGKKTTVFFPSGAFLRVDAEEWGLGITVQAPSIDYGATDGLCGTFDGSKENDTVSAVNEWRLAAKESLFDRLPTNKSPIPELKPIYCLCGEIGEGCMFQQPISRPNLFNGVDKTVEYIINAQQNFKEQSFGHSQEGGYASMMANTDQGRTFIGPAATQRFSNREGTFHHYSHNNRMRRSTTNVQELSHKQTRKSRRRKRQTAHRYNAPQSNLYPPLPHRPVHDDPWTYNNDYRNFQNQWSQNAQTTIKKPTYGHDERYQPAGQEENSARLSGETGKVPGLMSSAYGAQYPQHSNNYASGKQRGQQYNTPYYPQQQFSAYNYGAADTLPRSNYRQFQEPQNIQFGTANDGRQVTNGGFADEKNRKTMKATESVNTQQRRLTHNSDSYVNSMNYQNQPVKEHGYLNRINDRNYHQPVVHEVPRKQYQYVPLYEMPQNKHQSLTSSYRNAGDDYGVANGRQQQHLGIMSMGSNSNDAGFQPQHSFLRLQSDQPVSGLELNPSSDTTKLVVAQQAGNYLQQTHPKRNATQIASYQPRRSYVFLEDLFPKDSLKTDMTWPNFKGWTKISVTNKCENLIREMDIVQTCREVLSESLIQNVINICISDVHGKGDWIWAKRTRSLLENMCEENLIKTSSMWSKGLDGTLTAPQRILDSLNCPKACSNHGRCTTQGCECSAGFSGEDCSKEIGGADKEMSTVNGKAMTTETTTFPKVDHQTTSTSAAVITTSTPTTTTTKSPEVYATTATTIASTSTRLAEHTTAERSLTTAEDEKTTVLATHSTRISPIEKLTSLSTESLVITTRGDDKTVSDTTTTVEKAEPLLLTGAENDGECYITRSSCDNIVINAVGLNRGYPDSSPFKSVKCIVATLVPGSLPPPGVSYAGTVENEGQVRCTLPALTFAIMASEIRYDIKVVDGERESNSIEAVVYMGYGEQDPCRSGNKPHVMENQKTLSAFEGEEFIYQLTAVDPEDQFVYFELENAAESDVYMTPIGQVEWAVPIGGDATTKKISFTMQDQCGLTTRETVQVSADKSNNRLLYYIKRK